MAARTLVRRARPDAQGEPPGRTPSDPSRPLAWAAVALAMAPLVAALVDTLGRWTSVGDNALITLRSLDVLTGDHPLLGTWTSASTTVGFDLNNPGPLLFDLLALPARLLPREGPAIGVLLLGAACLAGLYVVATRRGGPALGALAVLVGAALCWSMGSDVLVEPWQPHSMLLPFLLFLFLVWSSSCGDGSALPWLVGLGSLIVQTHVSYGVLVPPLCAWAVLGLVLAARARRRADGPGGPGLRRVFVVALVVGALCWSQPVAEQVFGTGEGNMSRLVRAATEDAPEPIGYAKGVRLAGAVIGLPPWWVRPSFGDAWYVVPPENGLPAKGSDPPGLAPAAASLSLVVALLLGCLLLTRSRRDQVAARAVITALLTLALAIVTASRVPLGQFALAAHQFRFLWPVGAFVTFAALTTLVRAASGRQVRWPAVAAMTGLTLVVAVLAIPRSDQGASARTQVMPVIRDLGPQLASLEGEGPLIIDQLFETFGDPYGAAILLELRSHDISFVTLHDSLGRQIGDGRVAHRSEARGELIMRTGDRARTTPPGTRRVAFRDGLSAAEHRELRALRREVAAFLDGRRSLALTPDARPFLELGAASRLQEQLAAGTGLDGELLVQSRDLVPLLLRRMVDEDGPELERLERYAELQDRADFDTVALFLAPVR